MTNETLLTFLLDLVANYPKAIKQINAIRGEIYGAYYDLAYDVTPAIFVSYRTADDDFTIRVRLEKKMTHFTHCPHGAVTCKPCQDELMELRGILADVDTITLKDGTYIERYKDRYEILILGDATPGDYASVLDAVRASKERR